MQAPNRLLSARQLPPSTISSLVEVTARSTDNASSGNKEIHSACQHGIGINTLLRVTRPCISTGSTISPCWTPLDFIESRVLTLRASSQTDTKQLANEIFCCNASIEGMLEKGGTYFVCLNIWIGYIINKLDRSDSPIVRSKIWMSLDSWLNHGIVSKIHATYSIIWISTEGAE